MHTEELEARLAQLEEDVQALKDLLAGLAAALVAGLGDDEPNAR